MSAAYFRSADLNVFLEYRIVARRYETIRLEDKTKEFDPARGPELGAAKGKREVAVLRIGRRKRLPHLGKRPLRFCGLAGGSACPTWGRGRSGFAGWQAKAPAPPGEEGRRGFADWQAEAPAPPGEEGRSGFAGWQAEAPAPGNPGWSNLEAPAAG